MSDGGMCGRVFGTVRSRVYSKYRKKAFFYNKIKINPQSSNSEMLYFYFGIVWSGKKKGDLEAWNERGEREEILHKKEGGAWFMAKPNGWKEACFWLFITLRLLSFVEVHTYWNLLSLIGLWAKTLIWLNWGKFIGTAHFVKGRRIRLQCQKRSVC